eukprot:CAMPEP_0183334142 /NCGR_PEP_ID=MMETSP0164_2-20130417/2834_1 /TAXON_ID=221442 /ORGANISM="Coccolithus pelagicus ssp braarudi, Strain PLY182g" /LENGTH=92 /DNA_ID=CAMNT_0025503231 /DNA_START=1 /DNA_END=279 /DNA_ORIENTATION=-
MPDLAGEVVAQLEQLHASDRRHLHLVGDRVTLGLKQRGVRLMFVVDCKHSGGEVFFDMGNEKDAISLFVAMALQNKPRAQEYLSTSLHNDKG